MNPLELKDKKFGRLKVINRVENSKDGCSQWLCKCDCGNEKIIIGKLLKKGVVQSCGCLAKEKRKKATTKHGQSKSKLDNIYFKMKSRCYNKNDKFYKNYGARGIKVCKEWIENKLLFFEWAYKNGYNKNAQYMECTIDRIDVNGDYCPQNCRFVNIKTQCNNRTSNRLITYNGETHNLVGWEEKTGIKRATISRRLKLGWSIEDALTKSLCKNQYDHQRMLK